MSLLTYEDARPWARSIKAKVTAREMPPWHIDRNVGITKFKDDPSLTDAEIATIARWVDGGAPQGNPADMPPPRQFSEIDKWYIGKPDVIVAMDKPYVLPAAGPDNIVDVLIDPGFKEDMYMMAIESKPMDAKSFNVVASLHDEPGRGSRRGSDRAVPERVRARQERRHLPAELGPAGQGGHQDQLQPAPQSARRGDAVSRWRVGVQDLSEGHRAEVRRLLAAHG